ncbi:MAG TPA: hypothetical protein PKD83_05020 [Ignavibacteria bacterium]|nr:hypothetical protein [Ignavibacteria bacterium]
MNHKLVYEYMVEMDLPLPFDNEFISLIPEQRKIVDKLMREKLITMYAVSVEEGKLWTALLAESEDAAAEILMRFPIIELVEYRMYKLAFHNNIGAVTSQFSLN